MQKLNQYSYWLIHKWLKILAQLRSDVKFRLLNLRLVSPRENHLSDRALAMAAGAGKVLDQAKVLKIWGRLQGSKRCFSNQCSREI